MKNLLYLKNQANTFSKQKFVFKSVEKPSNQPSGAAPGSIAERMEKKFNTNLNVETKFTDLNAVLDDLGKKAQGKNPALSPDSIRTNLEDTLAPGKSLDDIMAHLKSKSCQTAAIIDGNLRFFAGAVGTKEISLSEFYKAREIKIGGEGTVTSEYLLRRQEIMQQNMQSLAALKGELPELPPNKK